MPREQREHCLWSALVLDETFPFLRHLLLCFCTCDCCALWSSRWLSTGCIIQAGGLQHDCTFSLTLYGVMKEATCLGIQGINSGRSTEY